MTARRSLTIQAVRQAVNYPLVFVEWIDSIGTQGWNVPDADLRPALIHSIGWLTAESPDHLTLTSHIQTGQIHHHSDLAIPRCAVRSLKHLR